MEFKGNHTTKLPKVGVTIFTQMSALAKECDAINLAQGFPDFAPHPKLGEALQNAFRNGENQYAPMAGNMLLREKIAIKTEQLYAAKVNPETEITITAGGTQAIFSAILAVVKENDEVIIFAPNYDCYVPAVELAGGKAIFYDLEAPNYELDWQKVKRLVSLRTKLIIINTPHNPTGKTFSDSDLKELEKITQNSNILLLSDEVYEHIIFDGKRHESVLRNPQLAERSLVISSFGKTYHCTGWKVGYIIAPANIMAEFRKVHQFNVFAVSSLAQAAFAEILDDSDWYLELAQFYETKRDFFRKLIQPSQLEILPCEGTYFQLCSYAKVSQEKDTDFVKWMTKEMKIAAIPVSAFYHNQLDHKIIRFCFAKETETLERAAEKILKIR